MTRESHALKIRKKLNVTIFGIKIKIKKIWPKNVIYCWFGWPKIYVGVKIGNSKAEILLKNAQKRKAKNFKLRCGAKIDVYKINRIHSVRLIRTYPEVNK